MDMKRKLREFFTLKRHANDGFTLVELIVVIAIVAILGGVAVPAYSGYIEKADRAADAQIIADINKAFAAACMVEGLDNYNASGATANVKDNKIESVTVNGVNEFDTTFKSFFDNEGAFKNEDIKLFYNTEIGGFAELPGAIADILTALTNGDYAGAISALKDSIFNDIGYGVLANQIDNAANLLAGFVGQENSGFHKLLTGDANLETLGKFVSEDELDEMIAKKYDQIDNDPDYANLTPEQKQNLAQGQILANTAILTAAQNSSAITSDFITSLENGNAVDLLKTSTDGGNASSDTIAQAAFAYAMYTSYKASQGQTVSGEVNIADVYETLGTDGFKNYMKNDSAQDQAGYKGAMELIAGSANNTDNSTAADILLNGFNSAELVGLMQNVTK